MQEFLFTKIKLQFANQMEKCLTTDMEIAFELLIISARDDILKKCCTSALCPLCSAKLDTVVTTSQGSHIAVFAAASLLLHSGVSVVPMLVIY